MRNIQVLRIKDTRIKIVYLILRENYWPIAILFIDNTILRTSRENYESNMHKIIDF